MDVVSDVISGADFDFVTVKYRRSDDDETSKLLLNLSDKEPENDKKRRKSDEDTNHRATVIPPDFRVWELVGNSSNGPSLKFKVVSYNVLAQYLLECHPYLYTDCSSSNLKWKVRAHRIYNEIIEMAPDILCLQEVQASHISSFYSKFEQIGYFGIYKQKIHKEDGCAIYFKKTLFELLDHISVELYQPKLPILNRDNIGLIVKLLPRNFPSLPIVVATTHLLYNPKRTDVRLAQIQVLLAEIDRCSYYNNGKECGRLPVILTGDFNSLPESPVIQLLDRGNIRASQYRDSSDWKNIEVTDNCQHLSVYLNRLQGLSTNNDYIKLYNSDYCKLTTNECMKMDPDILKLFSGLFNSGKLGHSLNLLSVYDKHKRDGEKEGTTYQDYWVTVDYIYFSLCSSLRLLERLRLPRVSECDVLGRLPNELYGSDHLAIAAIFELEPYNI